MSRAVAGALLVAAVALACAQPGTPPGGEVDRSPPRVEAVTPEAFDTLTDLSERVVIQFDERISERFQGVAELREAVLVSPVTGEVRADRKRRSIEVVPEGGWEPDRVYRVVVLPVFSDLFGNQREEPVELVFSTGAAITESAMAGFVRDRLTGEPVPEARVEGVRRADGTKHVAVTDTGGFFAMRFLPAGSYDLEAYLDQDRDAESDFFEAQDTAATTLEVDDTTVIELALLPMDTTPAQLARAEPIDSVRVRLVFDDYFAPDSVAGSVRLYLTPDSILVSSSGRLIHGSRLDSILQAERETRERRAEAAADTIAAIQDSLAMLRVDTGEARPDTTSPDTVGAPDAAVRPDEARRPSVDEGPASGEAAERRLPSQELILFLRDPLVPDTTYYVEVDGVVNIRGVPGGGGNAPFRTLPPPDTVGADTLDPEVSDQDTVPPDTTGGGGGR